MSMPMVGGYVMVDGTGLDEKAISDASTAGVTVAGIYAKFDAAYKTHKPVVIYNVITDSDVYGPFDVSIYGDSLAYQAALGTIVINVSADDKVTKVG